MPGSKHQIPGRVRSAYAFINAHRDRYSVQMMCRVLEVAASGYYEWLKHPISSHAQEDASLLRPIHASCVASHGIYGAPPRSWTCVRRERPAVSIESDA